MHHVNRITTTLALALLLGLSAGIAPAHAALECTADMQGANDEPGQKDLTEFCRDDDGGAPTYDFLVTWNWDDSAWPGNNTGDACALFDTDGDAFANYALCVTVSHDPAEAMSVREYSCGDDRPDRCSNAVQIMSFASMCTASAMSGADPFDMSSDTVASCGVDLDDFGGVAVAMLTDTCSFPSEQPNSDPSDCIINAPRVDPCIGVDCNDDNPCSDDACDGSSGQAVCVHTPGGQGIVCRPSAGDCDVAEMCDGLSTSCPNDGFTMGGTCRAAAGACDLPEVCDGSGAECPRDLKSTDLCRAAAGPCDAPESCDGTSNDCPGDGFISGTLCRAAAGVCDVADMCDGSGAQCPGDTKSTALCRAAAGPCDAPESCDGETNDCPEDGFVSGTVCRASAGVCDVADLCSGNSAECPADAKSTAVCRAAAGPCDVPESCDGSANNCPLDEVANAGTVCRRAMVECDVTEECDGTNVTCPANEFRPEGTPCMNDGNDCTDDMCDDGGFCVHPPNDAQTCDDFNPCTSGETCVAGECVGERVCEPTCRTAGFWGTHGGEEKSRRKSAARNITGAVIDGAGGFINVCGQVVDRSIPIGDLGSALEGLCVSVQGEQIRQLYRQLLAFHLNCVLSGESADCDVILPVAGACDELCAGGEPAGVTLGSCIAQLDCFNNGGRFVPDMGCALGECASEGFLFCGGDFGGCPDLCTAIDPMTHMCVATTPQACVPFPDSCHERDLCPADIDGDGTPDGHGFCFEPVAGASSSRECHHAETNSCTIDSCIP